MPNEVMGKTAACASFLTNHEFWLVYFSLLCFPLRQNEFHWIASDRVESEIRTLFTLDHNSLQCALPIQYNADTGYICCYWKPVLRALSRLSHETAPGLRYGFFLHAQTLLRQTAKIRGSATCSFPVFSLLTHHSTAHSTPFVPTGSLDESCTDADDWTNWTDLHQ